LNSGVTAGSGFIFWILAARLFPAEEVGLTSAILAVAGFLVTLANFGLDYGLVRFLPNSGQQSNSLVNSCFAIGGLTAIIASLIFLAGLHLWSPDLIYLRQNPLFLVSFVFIAAGWTAYTLLHNVFVAHKRAAFTLLEGIIQGITKLILIIIFAVFAYKFGIFASWGTGFVVAAIIGLFIFLPQVQKGYRPSFTINKGIISQMARFSLANYLAGLIAKVLVFVLPLMVINLLNAEQNAYFYMAYGVVSNALFFIPTGISLSLFAEGSHNEDGLDQDVRKSLKFSFIILVPLIIIIFLFGDKILLIFGKAYSEEATRLLQILAFAAIPGTVNTIYLYKMRVEKKMNQVVNLTILRVFIIIGLSYLLLPILGIMGAGIARLIGSAIITLIILSEFLLRKIR